MKIIINKKNVGSRIKQIRLNKGYTLEAFGKLFGAKKGNVQQWEKGISLPNKERIKDICKVADITVNELLYGSIEEFLEMNLEGFLENSEYPHYDFYKEYDLIKDILIYVENYNKENSEKVTVNDLNLIEKIVDIVVKDTVKQILEKYENLQRLMRTNGKEAFEAIKTYFFSYKNEKVRNSFFYIVNRDEIDYDAFGFIENFIENSEIWDKLEYYPHIKEIERLIEKELYSFYFTIGTTLYVFSLKRLMDVKINDKVIDLHSYIQTAESDDKVTLLLKTNKYNITDFRSVTGLYNEDEDTLYYLAHYSRIEDVPLNTEAQYFILNHDNTYQITKITEIPNCKYIAPIIGKLE